MTSDEGSDLIPYLPCLVPQILIAFVVCKHFLNRFAQLDQIKKCWFALGISVPQWQTIRPAFG